MNALIPSPALQAMILPRSGDDHPHMFEVPIEFVVDRCGSETPRIMLARRRVTDQAKPIARVFVREDRFYAEISFHRGARLYVPLDVWAWENKGQ